MSRCVSPSRLRLLNRSLLVLGLTWCSTAALAGDIQTITLSTAGVAEIERSAQADKEGALHIRVPLNQVDDVLKTLTAIDGTHRIASVTLAGLAPLQETFDSLPFSAEDLRSPAALAHALRGVQVKASSQGRNVSGAVLGVQNSPPTRDRAAQTLLTVLADNGQIQTLELGPDANLDVLDSELQKKLQRATQVLASQSNDQSRDIHIVLDQAGQGPARLSYLIPAPVWKSTYRLMLDGDKARLQAWAVFENTSGEDWKQVKVTLSSGSPVVLRQRLLERYWNQRPELPVAVGSALAPAADTQSAMQQARTAQGAALQAKASERRMAMPAPIAPVMAEMAQDSAWAQPYGPEATSQTQENLSNVRFSLPQALDVPAGQTVSVPFVDTELKADALSVYRSGQSSDHPTAAILLDNQQTNSLPPGIITVFDQRSGHVGDAELAGLPAGEQRLIYFARDNKVQVRAEQTEEHRLSRTRVADGIARSDWTRIQHHRFQIKGAADQDRQVLIQLPRQDGWTLQSDAHDSDTAQEHRLRVKVPKGQTVTVTAQLSIQDQMELSLEDIDENLLTQWRGTGMDTAQAQRMDELIALRRQLSQAQDQQKQTLQTLEETVSEQERIRANLGAVTAQSTLGQRFTEQLAAQEDQIAALRATLQERRQAVRQARDAFQKALSQS
ncbi:MAG TPA: DUF4139 domain-containing protein [Alcaligenes sp.]|nr:DUF4139 domain-containing protein [Alcaligenes sp.]HRL28181.1 DUF4139 domain-containing protein [Alcaligenes sp.]